MSVDSAQAFLETWFRGDLKQIIRSDATEEQFFAIVKESGFDFTREEWEQVAAPPRRELSEAELGEVSGGGDPRWVIHVDHLAYGRCGNNPSGKDESGHFDMSKCYDATFRACHQEPCVGANWDHSHPGGDGG